MSEAKHTPAPWHVSGGTVYALHGEPQRNRFFAQVQRGRSDDASHGELIANTRLMGASPELLAAAQCALNVLTLLESEVKALGCNAKNVPDKLRAAIAKALAA